MAEFDFGVDGELDFQGFAQALMDPLVCQKVRAEKTGGPAAGVAQIGWTRQN